MVGYRKGLVVGWLLARVSYGEGYFVRRDYAVLIPELLEVVEEHRIACRTLISLYLGRLSGRSRRAETGLAENYPELMMKALTSSTK
jgi:hypothetical protein